ncbi:interferon gamma 1 precursor [Esox lucius]|uniref:Interferon gamma n=1 Tax=Esox lucius TaxID=8010 RepID=A0A3P8YBH7_ESOLU|nr:interferon gamma 1 precursor [Esox lucius]
MDMLLRAVLCVCLLDTMTSGWGCEAQHTSDNMKTHIERLRNHFKISKDQLYNGHPVFAKETFQNKYEDNERRVLMSVVLEVYLSLFTHMLNQTADQEPKDSLIYVQKKVQDLQKHYFLGNIPELKRLMQDLWAIKTSDSLIQGKALSQLRTMYEEASKLANHIYLRKSNRRKRRQALRHQAMAG